MKREDSPGVKLQPPLVYGLFFGISFLFHGMLPLDKSLFSMDASKIIGFLLLSVCLVFDIPSLVLFFRSKNTVITQKAGKALDIRYH